MAKPLGLISDGLHMVIANHALRVLSTLSFLALAACASSSLQVQSLPDGADVQIVRSDRSVQKIGQTPLTLEEKNTPILFKEPVQVQVVKEGYQAQSILVPKMKLGGAGTVFANLGEASLPKYCTDQEHSFNEMARGVAEISNLIQRKRYPEAATLVQSLVSKYSNVSVLYDLQGNIFYLQRDMAKALESYRQSNVIQPNVPGTLRMIKKIEQLQGTGRGG